MQRQGLEEWETDAHMRLDLEHWMLTLHQVKITAGD
jgi:hypothetical protein